MKLWPKMRLDECCKVVSGGTPKTNVPSYWNGDIRWATPADLSGLDSKYINDTPRRITTDGLRSCSATVLPVNSVLLSSRAPIGHVAINTTPMATNQGFKSLIPHPDLVDSSYLYYWLRANKGYLESLGTGATFKEVSKAVVSKIEIPLPSIQEQRQIAEMLDRAHELRAKRRQTIALLDDIAQSIFLDMFGDPASNLRNWDVVPLGEISSVQGGLQVTSKRNSLPIEVAYLRVANVYRNHLNLEEIKTMRVTERELARTALEKGDLLVVEGHGNPQEIGRVAQWDSSIVPCVHQNHLIRVRLDECARPAYILALLNSIGGRRHLLRSASTTSGLNTISTADVKATPIMLPPQALQDEYVRRAEQVNQARAAMCASLQELDELFLSLQARAFRGKL